MNDENSTPSHGNSGSGIVQWFIGNRVAVNLLMLFLISGGIMATFNMRMELFPCVDPRTITIQVPYPGATPNEVEDGITRRLEEAVIGVEGVKQVTSIAQENIGVVTLEVEEFINTADVLDDVENAVDQLVEFPPQDAEEMIVTLVKPQPEVITLALYGDVPELTLKGWAERIKDEMVRSKGISLVSLTGDRDYEISIEISENNLRRYNLTLEEVGGIVAAWSLDLPAGTVESESGDILLRVQEKGYTGEAFEQIVVRSGPDGSLLRSGPDGSLLRLGNIATIVDGFKDDNLITRYNGQSAIFIKVSRSESQDALAVEQAVLDFLEEVRLPAGIRIDILEDRTVLLKQRMNLLLRNGLIGYTLVFLVLLLFLDLKLAFWTSLGIPISFLGGLLVVNLIGMSFNMITLFALIVVLGIVVDDAIVIGESIFTEQEAGSKGAAAAAKGVMAVRAPVTIGVLTTVAAFAPLAFTTGTLGQIMRPIPIFVISILLISLVEAFIILPAHLSSSSRWSRGIVADISENFNRMLNHFVDSFFLPLLRKAIELRYAVLALFAAILLIMFGMVQGGIIRFIFFPQIEGDQVTATLVMPVGTPFEVTEKNAEGILNAAAQVQADLQSEEGKNLFKSTSLIIGALFSEQGPAGAQGVSATTSNRADLRIQLIDAPLRTVSARDVEYRLQEAVGNIPNVDELSYNSSLVSGGEDIKIELANDDVDLLSGAVSRLKEKMGNLDGVTEIADTLKAGKLEYVFELTPEGLAAGLKPGDIGRQLRNAFFGYEVQRIQRAREELKVMVRYPKDEREQIHNIYDFRINLPDGGQAPITQMTKIREQRSYEQIIRVNAQRVANVTADVDEQLTTPQEVLDFIMTEIIPTIREEFPGLSARVAGESEDRNEDMASLAGNMLIALLIIFVMLGAQLRSYVQPLIVMAVIPFGVVGALLGHLLLGYDLSFISAFGIVALTGVVINDSVVLIDYYNKQHREEGLEQADAICKAVRRRLRPILLTTMTTSLALLPMLLESSLQARFLIPMAISLAFGLLFASFVLLLLLPIMLRIVSDLSPPYTFLKFAGKK
ncbi:MAG: efflux RND transporter permease subunit [Desulfopila sp.]